MPIDKLDPLAYNVPITNEDRTPTYEFMRKWSAQQQTQAVIETVQVDVDALNTRQIIAGVGLTGGGTLAADVTLDADTQEILDQISTTRGVVLYRNATDWVALAPGTAGNVLTTHGAGADPTWDPGAANIQTLLNGLSTTQGAVIYRNATVWVALAPGTAGNVLTTHGAAADPTWAASGGGGSTDPFAYQVTPPANPGFDPNFIEKSSGSTPIVLSNSNKRAVCASATPFNHMFGTPGKHTGKFYWEGKFSNLTDVAIGITGSAGRHWRVDQGSGVLQFGSITGQLAWLPTGVVNAQIAGAGFFTTPTTIATIQTYAINNNLGIAVDFSTQQIWFRTNAGNWNNNAANNPATGVGGISLAAAMSGSAPIAWPGMSAGNTGNCDMFLLAADWGQAAPAGFAAWGA